MADNFDTVEILLCECCSHGLSVSRDEETKTVWFTFWKQGRKTQNMPWLDRIRYAINILRGEVIPDHVGLSPKNVKRLIEKLEDG